MGQERRFAARVLALGGVVGPVQFVWITILCAVLRPGYSHTHHFVSELGATGTAHAWVMNYLGFVAAGLLLCCFGLSAGAMVQPGRGALIGPALVTIFGLGVALSGLFSCDPGCPRANGSTQNLIHDRLAPLTFLAGSLGPVFLGLHFRRLPHLRRLWLYSVASGALGLVLLAAVASSLESRELTGLWQRLLLAVLFSWCATVSLKLFHAPGDVASSA